MTNFIVIVNRKYMVKVEANSNGGAEHKVLDNIKHSESALAFDPVKESQYYGWAYETCEMISFEELETKDRKATAAKIMHYNTLLEEEFGYKEEVRKLQERLARAQEMYDEAKEEAEQFRAKHGLNIGYTAPEKIAEMLK